MSPKQKAPEGASLFGCQCAHRSRLGALSLPSGFGLPASSGDLKNADLHSPTLTTNGEKRSVDRSSINPKQ